MIFVVLVVLSITMVASLTSLTGVGGGTDGAEGCAHVYTPRKTDRNLQVAETAPQAHQPIRADYFLKFLKIRF